MKVDFTFISINVKSDFHTLGRWLGCRCSPKNDAPRFPGARVSSDQAVRLAAAGTAVAGAAFAAAVGAGAGSRGRDREGQGGDRQKCEEEFFHFLNLR